MSRRSVACLVVLVAGLVLALLPWSIGSARFADAIVRQLKHDYGVSLEIRGRTTIALLPIPRVKLEDVSLSDPDGRFYASAGIVRAELRPAALALLRLRIAELSVSDAIVRVETDGEPHSWSAALETVLREGAARGPSDTAVERLVVSNSAVKIVRTAGPPLRIEEISARLRWPEQQGDLDALASARWNGETVSASLSGLNPARLVRGEPDAFEGGISTRLGTFDVAGELTWRDGPRYDGKLAARTGDLGALTRWTGVGLDLQDFSRRVDIAGTGTIGPDGLQWPQGRLSVGEDVLEGALGIALSGERPQLRATLAGDTLDLGWLVPIANPLSAEPPACDYDVRLSASLLKLGRIQLRDAATAILVNGERLEFSLARAGLGGGSVRGRLTASLDAEGRDLKAQVGLDRVDLGRALPGYGVASILTGTVGGQATLEIAGDRRPDLAAVLRGRATLTASDGEIAGISLANLPARQADVPVTGSTGLERRGTGRTRFHRAAVSVEFGGGAAEILDGAVETATTRTRLQGQVSLRTGALALRTSTVPAGADGTRPGVVLDVRGQPGRLIVSGADEPRP